MDQQKAKMVAQIIAIMRAQKWILAVARIEEALKMYPADYGFLEFMGVANLNQKNPKDAARFFKKALKQAPKNAIAYRNLANAEALMGEPSKAQANLWKALKLNPKLPDAWMMLGRIHAQKGQDEKATDCYRKAAQLQPDSAVIAVKLLTSLNQQNKLDELESRVGIIAKLAPDHPVVKLFKGIIYYRKKDISAAKDILEAFDFKSKNMVQFRELELLRNRYLGLACDELHLETDAIEYFTRVKALNRSFHQNPAPPAYFWKMCAMREAYFKSEAPKSWVYKSSHKDEPVFMVGFPRSGTTLLDTFLRGHRDLALLEEKPATSNLRVMLGTSADHDISALDSLDKKALSAVRKTYFDELRSYKPKGLVIDKLPMNIVFAGEILRVFPRAKFIFVMRDPADAVLSSFMQSFKLNPSMAALDSLKDAAQTYALSMQTWKSTVQALDPAIVTSRYEDLISDPEKTLRPIVSFLGVEWDDAVLDHQITAKSRARIHTPSHAQVVKPLYQSSVARWERYAAHMPEALEILAPWREEYGYSD
ncbi:MAG: sulfotransferase [Rhodobacteraceae bacterium]|nr:sulfotransferase [Paracoccaceae bacterium]